MSEYAPTCSGERDTPAPTGRQQPDEIVHREQDRAALTDNHRDGMHDARESASCVRATMGGASSGGWCVCGLVRSGTVRASACPFPRGDPFRMIELNAVGWSALLAHRR
jgi:hypothetical protein